MNYGMLLARRRIASLPVISIASQPQTTIATTTIATLSVVASVDTGAVLAYQWQRSANTGSSWEDVPGATASTLSLSGLGEQDNGILYRVILSAPRAVSVVSSAASLFIAVGGIVITQQPQDVTHNRGQSAVTTMSAYSVVGGSVSYAIEIDANGDNEWDGIYDQVIQLGTSPAVVHNASPAFTPRYARYRLNIAGEPDSTIRRYSRTVTITTIG
jgi:hypothetical protein